MMREETDRHREGNSEIPHPTLINSAIITVLFIALPMALRIISLDPFSCIHANTKKFILHKLFIKHKGPSFVLKVGTGRVIAAILFEN